MLITCISHIATSFIDIKMRCGHVIIVLITWWQFSSKACFCEVQLKN